MKKSTAIYIVMLLAVAAAAWYVSQTYYQLLMISGDSMAPAYRSGALTIIDRQQENYEVGDVVLFNCDGLGCNLVKRIVALPGDSVHIDGGQLQVNGEIPECPPGDAHIANPGIAEAALIVPEDCCFVLGDNLSQSVDSRDERVGMVRLANIIGVIIN